MQHAPLFIIGMHRSGTTLLTQLVREMGWFMGENRDTNEETHLLIHTNEQMLHRAGATWDAPYPILQTFTEELFPAAYPAFLRCLTIPEKLFFLGERRYAECRGNFNNLDERWGAKDPRLTFTLPLWKTLFPEMRILHITRHGVDVAASLQRRHERLVQALFTSKNLPVPGPEQAFWTGIVRHTTRCLDLNYGLELWRQYVEMARAHVSAFGERALEVKFEDLLAEPERVLGRVADFIGPETPPDIPALAALVKKERRFSFEQDTTLASFAKAQDTVLRAVGY